MSLTAHLHPTTGVTAEWAHNYSTLAAAASTW